MISQPTFLLDEMDRQNTAVKKAKAEEFQRDAWRNCWGWAGPKAGEHCEIDSCVVPTEHGETVYAYTEQVRLIDERADGTWLGEMRVTIDRHGLRAGHAGEVTLARWLATCSVPNWRCAARRR